MMRYRQLGHTDLRVSEIGIGCAAIGGGLYQRNDAEAIAMLRQALDQGVNFYDTSDSYSQGRSEWVIGRAFKGRRDRVIVASKVGTVYSSLATTALRMRPLLRPIKQLLRPFRPALIRAKYSQKTADFSPRHLREAIEKSLRHLQTDYLDLYQLHNPPPSLPGAPEIVHTLEMLKTQGKIRHYGVSCAQVEDAILWLAHPGIASIQVEVNLLNQAALPAVLPLAQQRAVGVIARVPYAQGLLTGTRQETKAEQLYRSRDRRAFDERRHRAQAFEVLAHGRRTMAQAALQFVLQLPAVSVVIPGISRRPHLAEALGALAAPSLTPDELAKIAALSR